ncbi:unnamed protein product, partial [Amoebophrya sp. A25]
NTGQLDKKVVQRLLGLANFITVSAANRAGNEIMRSLYAWTEDATFDKLVKQRWQRRALLRST